jgi:short-subunit dehydrogenase
MTDINKEPEKKSALITGASSGIGKELARVFARQGHPLVLVARDEQRLDQLAHELRTGFGVVVEVVPQDLAGEGAVQEVINKLEQKSIVVDVLVNNAGFDVYGNFWETDLVGELQMIQVNQVALTELCKYLLGGMRERGGGKILNVGSTGSFIPTPFNAVYAATKAYVLSFSESLAEELRGSGVTVTVLCPGATRTEFQQRAGITSARLLKFGLMDAKSVAECGYRGVMKGKRIVVPGLLNKIQVFATRLLPRSLMTRIAKLMLAPGKS